MSSVVRSTQYEWKDRQHLEKSDHLRGGKQGDGVALGCKGTLTASTMSFL